jgi:hypothetical protein
LPSYIETRGEIYVADIQYPVKYFGHQKKRVLQLVRKRLEVLADFWLHLMKTVISVMLSSDLWTLNCAPQGVVTTL